MSSDLRRGLRFAFAAAFISGFSVFANKFFVDSFQDPYLFTTLKNTAVAALLISALAVGGRVGTLSRISLRDWLRLLALGLVGGSVPFLLFYQGLSMTSAANASLIHKSMFLYVGALAVLLFHERLNMRLLAVAFVLLTGNLVAVGLNASTFGFGDVLVFAATLLWAIETIIAKKALASVDTQVVAGARMFFGSIVLLAFLSSTGRIGSAFQLSARQSLVTAASAVILLSYVVSWYGGLKRLSATTASVILLVGSPVTTALSMLVLSRAAPAYELFGGVLILAGAAAYLRFQDNPQHVNC